MRNNLSLVDDSLTAHTCTSAAAQRAENLSIMGAQSILELCVGPSLRDLEREYSHLGMSVVGNDIDIRWKKFYPQGKWIIGDALRVDIREFDAVVFAPPLSHGCSGTREDSLSVDEVFPRYTSFLERLWSFNGVAVLVLPGRSMATRHDRQQYFSLMSKLQGLRYEVVPLTSGARRIVKYYDVYLDLRGRE